MTGTHPKTQQTSASTRFRSKKRKLFYWKRSKEEQITPKSLTTTTLTKMKTDSPFGSETKPDIPGSESPSATKSKPTDCSANVAGSSAPAGKATSLAREEWNVRMADMKRRSLEAKARTGSGIIQATECDREALIHSLKKMGRPKKPENQVLSENLPVRWSKTEAELLRKIAMEKGISPSEFVRTVVRRALKRAS